MKKFFLKSVLFSLIFFGIGATIFTITKARLPDSNGLTAQNGDKLTTNKFNALLPVGAVVSFNLSSCPTGWSEYTPAYGKFIRGIDKSGTSIDPDGQRALANIQQDAFQGHNHQEANQISITGPSAGPSYGVIATFGAFGNGTVRQMTKDPVADSLGNGTPRTANETRPKNVALLYCVKN